MLSCFMKSQSSFRPGGISTDVTGVGNVARDMVRLDVRLDIYLLIFFSTNITSPQYSFLVSLGRFSSGHHGLDLFVKLVSFHTDQGS